MSCRVDRGQCAPCSSRRARRTLSQRVQRGIESIAMGEGRTALAKVMASFDRDLSLFDEFFVDQSIDQRRAILGLRTVREFVELLEADRSEARRFAEALDVCHSEFFRNPLTFAVIEQVVLPKLMEEHSAAQETGHGRGTLRVWSAGCATGEEPYSLAILLHEAACARSESPNFRIFATDRSVGSLEAARKGIYGSDSVANVRQKHLERYFRRVGSDLRVRESLAQVVDFSVHDLADMSTPFPPVSIYGEFDIVLCCNVLVYYAGPIRSRLVDTLVNSLAGGGYLVLGEVERRAVEQPLGLLPVVPPAPVFRKAAR